MYGKLKRKEKKKKKMEPVFGFEKLLTVHVFLQVQKKTFKIRNCLEKNCTVHAGSLSISSKKLDLGFVKLHALCFKLRLSHINQINACCLVV